MTTNNGAVPAMAGSAGASSRAEPIRLYPAPVVPRTAEQALWNDRAAIYNAGRA